MTETPVYIEESCGYRVEVRTEFDFGRSNPLQQQYFFLYTIVISNLRGEPAQLVSRVWHIQDANGEVREVQGPGVVGHTPRFRVGDAFEYSSYCPLATMTGKMWGSFQMRGQNGKDFEITTPVFRFMVPESFIDRY